MLFAALPDALAATRVALVVVPWEHSALRAKLYLQGAPSAVDGASAARPALSEAAQAWAVTKDSESAAVLRAFSERYSGTVYAELARARLNEIESEARQRPPSPQRESVAKQRFDGLWRGTWEGSHCARTGGEWAIFVDGTAARHQSGAVGSVSASGDLAIDVPSKLNPSLKLRFKIKLSGDAGKGTFQAIGHPCKGTAVLNRSPHTTAAGSPK